MTSMMGPAATTSQQVKLMALILSLFVDLDLFLDFQIPGFIS